MEKAKLITATMLVITATLGAAHAAQVIGTSCPDENTGTLDETASHQTMVCANGKWQDVRSVPEAITEIAEYGATNSRASASTSTSFLAFVGTRVIRQITNENGQFTLIARVVALNPDNTAHIVIDFDDAGTKKHVDATVPLDTPTAITTVDGSSGYRVTIRRIPA